MIYVENLNLFNPFFPQMIIENVKLIFEVLFTLFT